MRMERLTEILMDWYRLNKRDLPWRETKDPYRIWISEIILQQTRVAQGYDYYQRFVERFPDVHALAQADEDEVLRLWQGLGYYSRARNLHRAARSISPGEFPHTYAGVKALPGIGDYTSAAICSIAYDMPYAVVDGNVYRVLARYFGMDVPIDSTRGKKEFAALAQAMLDIHHPALYNQAIMDFGALQCTPTSPHCASCPLADGCLALAQGQVELLPVKAHKTKVTPRYLTYIYVTQAEDVLLRKREEGDIWAGLYEFPLIESSQRLSFSETVSALRQEGVSPEAMPHLVCEDVKHILSHRVLHVDFYTLHLPKDSSAFPAYRRIPHAELEQYAMPRLLLGLLAQKGVQF